MRETGAGRLSLVVEMDNAEMLTPGEIEETISALTEQLRLYGVKQAELERPQLIFVHPGTPEDSELLSKAVADVVPDLDRFAELEFLSLPEGRYYELKNRGVAEARGDTVVFLDSDTVPEKDWLKNLVDPLDDPDVVATNGYTSLMYDDFLSRVYALFWIFPLRNHDDRLAAKRPLNANNCALRRVWLAENPFPENSGFKVSCSLLSNNLRMQNLVLRRVDAHVSHKPPRGWRFFIWRALVMGRDADRRFMALRSDGRGQRVANSFSRLFSAEWRAARRLAHARYVGIPFWQTPFAFALISLFNGLVFFGQVAMAAGLTRDTVERVPDYVERS